ncbi:MAG TPA: hypothetical protein VFK85_11420 [Anaeromyxobacteraceae bacterium]|nr:hypothetical protein [Anaeromyxobacteraceae bacterium]
MTVAVVLVLVGLSVAGYVLNRRRRARKPLPREAGRVVIASNLAASRRR